MVLSQMWDLLSIRGTLTVWCCLLSPFWNPWIYKVCRGAEVPSAVMSHSTCAVLVLTEGTTLDLILCDFMNVDIKAVANTSVHPQRWVTYLLNIKIRIQYCAKVLNQPQFFSVCFFHWVFLKACGSLSLDISSIPLHSSNIFTGTFCFCFFNINYDWCCVHIT